MFTCMWNLWGCAQPPNAALAVLTSPACLTGTDMLLTAITPASPPLINRQTHRKHKTQQKITTISFGTYAVFLSSSLLSREQVPKVKPQWLDSPGICVCWTLGVFDAAGRCRGHMLKMKMGIYHHAALRKGQAKQGIEAAWKEQMSYRVCFVGGRTRIVWRGETDESEI